MNKTITVCMMLAFLSGASMHGSRDPYSGPAGGGDGSDNVEIAVNQACAPMNCSNAKEAAVELFERVKKLAKVLTAVNWEEKTKPFFQILSELITEWDDEPLGVQKFYAISGGSRHELSLYFHIGREATSNSSLNEFYVAVNEVLFMQKMTWDERKKSVSKASYSEDGASSALMQDEGKCKDGNKLSKSKILAASAAALTIFGVVAYYMFGSSNKKVQRKVVPTK